MTQTEELTDSDGNFKLKIPRTISVGNLATILGGTIFAIAAIVGATQWYDGLGKRFDAMTDRMTQQDISRTTLEHKIDMIDDKIGQMDTRTGANFEAIRLELTHIKDRLDLQKKASME